MRATTYDRTSHKFLFFFKSVNDRKGINEGYQKKDGKEEQIKQEKLAAWCNSKCTDGRRTIRKQKRAYMRQSSLQKKTNQRKKLHNNNIIYIYSNRQRSAPDTWKSLYVAFATWLPTWRKFIAHSRVRCLIWYGNDTWTQNSLSAACWRDRRRRLATQLAMEGPTHRPLEAWMDGATQLLTRVKCRFLWNKACRRLWALSPCTSRDSLPGQCHLSCCVTPQHPAPCGPLVRAESARRWETGGGAQSRVCEKGTLNKSDTQPWIRPEHSGAAKAAHVWQTISMLFLGGRRWWEQVLSLWLQTVRLSWKNNLR